MDQESRKAPELSTGEQRPRPGKLNDVSPSKAIAGDASSGDASKEGKKQYGNVPVIDTATFATGKGGGAMRPIDQTFKVNASTGTVSLSVPLPVTAARHNFQPSLSLSYSSGGGNGSFGLGWQLSTEAVTRKTAKGVPLYDDDEDVYILSGYEDLVPVVGDDGLPSDRTIDGYLVRSYLPRIEQEPMRIERWTNLQDANDTYWRTISGANITKIFGRDENSRVSDFGSDSTKKRIFSWLIYESYDSSGNAIQFTYKAENHQLVEDSETLQSCEEQRNEAIRCHDRYLKSVKYGNQKPSRDLETWDILPLNRTENDWMFEAVFDYGEHDAAAPTTAEVLPWVVRKDVFSNHTAGFEIRTYRLCRRMLMFHHFAEKLGTADYLVSSVHFQYDESPTGSFLTSVTQNGHKYDSAGQVLTESLAPCSFGYQKLPDFAAIPINTMKPTCLQTLHESRPETLTQWIDLDGEGLPGLLLQLDGSWYYQRNENAIHQVPEDGEEPTSDSESESLTHDSFGPVRQLPLIPNVHDYSTHSFEDLDGNGHQSLVSNDESGRPFAYQECLDPGDWTTKQLFPVTLNKDLRDESIRRVDLTGDGLADIMTVDNETGEVIWHQSLGKRGFGSERRSSGDGKGNRPRLLHGDLTKATFLADMSGDGLSDIVQICNGQVSYWPNLGHGRFGREVVMGNSPFFEGGGDVVVERIELLDVDGSGTTDLAYLLPQGGAVVYLNQCGNSWSDAVPIPQFPAISQLTSVFTIDLLGKGTSCLCWVGPDGNSTDDLVIYYLDLADAGKPHLLTSFSNGIGLETSIQTRPSTYYYLRDEREGTPWKTRLPFPVHVVSKTVQRDLFQATAKISKYRYHDGFFDPREREFRGFGRVDTWEYDELKFEPDKKPYRQPTCYSKVWYHTGTPDETLLVPSSSETFTTQYLQSIMTDETDLPVFGRLDALRSLKGSVLRSEVYELDGTEHRHVPHAIDESSLRVEVLQAGSRCGTRPWVFRTSPLESLSQIIPRASDGAWRMKHEIVLERDHYGNPTKAISAAYGRLDLSPAKKLTPTEAALWDAQRIDEVAYTETQYTGAVEKELHSFYSPMTAAVRSYRLLGIKHDGILDRMLLQKNSMEIIRTAVDQTMLEVDSDYLRTSAAPSGKAVKVQIGESRTYYRSRDLTRTLPLGSFEPFSIVDQSFQLALTPELSRAAYSTNVSDAIVARLMKDGGHVDLDNDNHWWLPSGKERFCSPSDKKPLHAELQQARQSFYSPLVYVDQFGNESVVEMDEYWRLPTKSSDALGNSTRVQNDYRVLQPVLMTDPNGNRKKIAVDVWGNIIAAAHMGKDGEDVGDDLKGFTAYISDDAVLAFIQNPTREVASSLLGNASNRWHHCRKLLQIKGVVSAIPTFALELTRTQHTTPVTRPDDDQQGDIMVSLSYFGGSRQTIQTFQLTSWVSGESQWCVTSSMVSDSSSNVVKTYNPFFSPSGLFKAKVSSPASISFFDALGRSKGALMADHSWSKVLHDPWASSACDAGSTALVSDPRSDPDVGRYFASLEPQVYLPTWYQTRSAKTATRSRQAAAEKSRLYDNNTTTTHLSAGGKVLVTAHQAAGKRQTTRSEYDVSGNVVKEIDGRNIVVQQNRYDMLGRRLAIDNIDSGKTLWIFDCDGQIVLQKNARGITELRTYDELSRPVETRICAKGEWTGKPGETYVWARREYGEKEPEAATHNLRGRLVRVFDQSGKVAHTDYDFLGNCTRSAAEIAVDFKSELDWSTEVKLEETVYISTSTYDALGRAWLTTDPLGHQTRRKYNLRGHLAGLYSRQRDDLSWACYISRCEYTADGRPCRVEMGNGVQVAYEYDPASRQLVRKRSVRQKDNSALEDLSYSYDAQGRLSCVDDKAQQEVFFRNEAVGSSNEYWYDGFGRLIKATGRESVSSSGNASPTSKDRDAMPADGKSMTRYTETYEYDDGENLLKMQHDSSAKEISGWTRRYAYESTGNRLTSCDVSGSQENYGYEGDAGFVGCMTSMPGFSRLSWNHVNRLRSTSRQNVEDDAVPVTTWFVYDHTGARVRKVTEHSMTADEVDAGSASRKMKETIFLGACEIYRHYQGDGLSAKYEKSTSKIFRQAGSDSPFAELDSQKGDNNPSLSGKVLVRYLISTGLQLDDQAQVISYEEYSPYGSTTMMACRSDIEAPSSYRYATYYKDTETGLFLCGTRYYAPWLGRWTSPDTIDTRGGLNLYCYAKNDPINWSDPDGTAPGETNPPSLTVGEKFKAVAFWAGFQLANRFTQAVIFDTLIADKVDNALAGNNTNLDMSAGNSTCSTNSTMSATNQSQTVQGSRVDFARVATIMALGIGRDLLAWGLQPGASHLASKYETIKKYTERYKNGQKVAESALKSLGTKTAAKLCCCNCANQVAPADVVGAAVIDVGAAAVDAGTIDTISTREMETQTDPITVNDGGTQTQTVVNDGGTQTDPVVDPQQAPAVVGNDQHNPLVGYINNPPNQPRGRSLYRDILRSRSPGQSPKDTNAHKMLLQKKQSTTKRS